ncbi:tetratricopeptide repeat protein [Kaarinaea lacus]
MLFFAVCRKSALCARVLWTLVPVLVFGLPLPALADLDNAFDAVHQKDYATAYQLFLQAAEAGNAEAQYNLGVLIRSGQGTEKDPKRALSWFEKSAAQGWADAQYQLGNMYEFGLSVPQSYQNAAALYKKAAEQGHASAQTNLAVLYANGQGVNQDIVLAYVWSNLAASQGIVEALQNREVVAQEMSPEMLQRVRTISREYFQKYVAPFQSETSRRLVGQPPELPPKHQ